ncbi:hypothetical protein AAFF_G00041190 [Aldrovandia affinis]|uniref:Uncharacterized protein n=1 Tax=Aldrovandia affinis TaxID=143900 RepID=A0AAD7S2G2_9TELE|nr:hypothetical protein AAFF_G00041190 [Aldrovandia affinis]
MNEVSLLAYFELSALCIGVSGPEEGQDRGLLSTGGQERRASRQSAGSPLTLHRTVEQHPWPGQRAPFGHTRPHRAGNGHRRPGSALTSGSGLTWRHLQAGRQAGNLTGDGRVLRNDLRLVPSASPRTWHRRTGGTPSQKDIKAGTAITKQLDPPNFFHLIDGNNKEQLQWRYAVGSLCAATPPVQTLQTHSCISTRRTIQKRAAARSQSPPVPPRPGPGCHRREAQKRTGKTNSASCGRASVPTARTTRAQTEGLMLTDLPCGEQASWTPQPRHRHVYHSKHLPPPHTATDQTSWLLFRDGI